MVQLTPKDFVARGKHRAVYRHPEDDRLLIKVARQNDANTSSLKKMIKKFHFSEQYVREFIEHLRLRANLEHENPYIQKLAGFADTNLGFGQIVQAEKDKNGDYAPTLYALLRDKRFDKSVQEQLEIFYNFMQNTSIIISDFHCGNLLYSYNSENGYHFVLVDGIGDKTFIPLLRLSSWLRSRTRKRKIKQQKIEIKQLIKRYK